MIMWILQVFVLMKAATLWNQVRHDAESKKNMIMVCPCCNSVGFNPSRMPSYGISRQHMWLQQYVTIFLNTMYYLVATALFSKPNSAHVFSTCEWKMPPWQLPTHAPSSMFYIKNICLQPIEQRLAQDSK